MSKETEEGTGQQSKCSSWGQLRRLRVTASRFREACVEQNGSAEQESAAKALAPQMIRGSTKQTAAMKCGLLVGSAVLVQYAEV